MFDAAPAFPSSPLPQSAEFARALDEIGLSTEQIQISDDYGQALLQSRLLPVLGQFGLISRGPVWGHRPCAARLRDSLARIGYPVFINAQAGQSSVMRQAGLVQVMTPATLAMLDVTGPPCAFRVRMHGKWRNRLRRAEAAGLTVRRTALPDARAGWVYAAEAVQRRARHYRGLPVTLATAYGQANPGGAQLFEAIKDGVPLAGMIFLRHGTMATYFLGVTTEDGRAVHAHNLLLDRAAAYLGKACCEALDLGTLDTEAAPGLARFKLGSGAQAQVLGGTWLYTRALAAVTKPKRRLLRRGLL